MFTNIRFPALTVLTFCILLAGCEGHADKAADPNAIWEVPVTTAEDFDDSLFTITLAELADLSERNDNLLYVLSHAFWEKDAGSSHVRIRRQSGEIDAYESILIFDDMKGDSVRSYRYQLKLHKSIQGVWQLVDAKKSWRCWPDRGQQTFDTQVCR